MLEAPQAVMQNEEAFRVHKEGICSLFDDGGQYVNFMLIY
jgi:hypothetical protein